MKKYNRKPVDQWTQLRICPEHIPVAVCCHVKWHAKGDLQASSAAINRTVWDSPYLCVVVDVPMAAARTHSHSYACIAFTC